MGAVFTPHTFLPGFSLSADYYRIKVTSVIQGLGRSNILDNCAKTGDGFLAPSFTALQAGSLWLGTKASW